MNKKDLPNTSHFFHGAFSIDMVLISFRDGHAYVLLTEKKEFTDVSLGLPGQLIDPDQDTDEAMKKMMDTLIGTDHFYKKQLPAFSGVDRHPLGRVISFSYYGLIRQEDLDLKINARPNWCQLDQVPELAFDHSYIFKKVLKRFRKGLLRHPTVFELIPKGFILSEIINVYEYVFNQKIDRPNFRKYLIKSQVILPLNRKRKEKGKSDRPSKLYSFNREAYKGIKDRVRFNF